MSHTIERDWITEAGLRAICTVILHHGTEVPSHRCGYICLPAGHPLHGKDSTDKCDSLGAMLERLKSTPMAEIEHLHSFPRMLAMLGGPAEPRPDFVFSVHGGITYSSSKAGDDYPLKTDDGWWYGFDCNHCDDGYIKPNPWFSSLLNERGVPRTHEYVVAECESLASQLSLVNR